MVRKGMSRLGKYQVPFVNRVFLRDEVLVHNEINETEIVLKRNPRYFLKNVCLMTVSSLRFIMNYKMLKYKYRTFLAGLKQDNFWRGTFNK